MANKLREGVPADEELELEDDDFDDEDEESLPPAVRDRLRTEITCAADLAEALRAGQPVIRSKD